MSRKSFGQLVAALRKELRDENDKVWTQERLAGNCGLSNQLLGKIERGEKSNLNSEVLIKIADALCLSSIERKEFFIAALGVDNHKIPKIKEVQAEQFLIPLLQALGNLQLPAYIEDVFSDIVAVNASIFELLTNSSPDLIKKLGNSTAGWNILNFIFSEETGFKRLLGNHWESSAIHNVQNFRRFSLRYRSTTYFAKLLRALKQNRSFRRLWNELPYEEVDNYADFEIYDYYHLLWGPMRYMSTISEVVTPFGELWLAVYLPQSSATENTFNSLIQKVGNKVYRFAEWPNKELKEVL